MQDHELESYSLRLEGRGISVSRDVGQDAARAILDIIMGGEVRGRTGTLASEPNDSSEERGRPPLSLREFLENSGAKRNPDKIATIGRYIISYEGKQVFGRDEVKGRFREIGEPLPSNFSRDFAWALRSGLIAEDPGNRGLYYVTNKGIEAIDGKFSSDIVKKTGQKKTLGSRR
jgi:hypothetical protein